MATPSDSVEVAGSPPVMVVRGFRERVFSWRLPVGLAFVALGACVARPHTLWGEHVVLGWLASLGLVLAGMALRFWAAGSAGTHTHSATIEGPQLATGGPYAFVRNPIYLGSMILGLGMIGMIGDARLFPLHVAAFVILYAILVPAEERYLRATFREEYDAYCANVSRFVPRLSPWGGSTQRSFHWDAARGEIRLFGVLVVIYAVLELVARIRQQF